MTTTPSLAPITADLWNRGAARHLLNRAGFGVPLRLVETLAALTPERAVSRLVDFEAMGERPAPPPWLSEPERLRGVRNEMARVQAMNFEGREPSPAERTRMEQERQRIRTELDREEREAVERMKAWWLDLMIRTERPLEEKMALFWHGHFATSAQKVREAAPNHDLNDLFRTMAVGSFRDLTAAVGRSPAMLRYLDNAQSNKHKPNENWARELMELFTMGPGNYSEADIKNSARAFTGWTLRGERFHYNDSIHDAGRKRFLGKEGNFGPDDILHIIFEQRATAEFICAKLWRFFAYDDPEPGIVAGLADTLVAEDYEIRPVLRRMFLSRAFYSERARGAVIKSPAQFVVTLLSHLEVDYDQDFIIEYVLSAMRQMGQELFNPPNVKGWDGGRAWINTNTLMARYNLGNFLVQGVATDTGGDSPLGRMLARNQRGMSDDRRERLMFRAGNSTMAAADEAGIMAGSEGIPRVSMNMAEPMGVVGDRLGPKGLKLPIAPFDEVAFFSRVDGMSATRVVDAMVDYFLDVPMNSVQKGELVEALAGSLPYDTPMNAAQWDRGRLRGVVHLLLSSAEFQLC